MKRFLNIILVLLLTLILFGCTDTSSHTDNQFIEEEVIEDESYAHAYFKILKHLMKNNTGLISNNVLYIAADLSELEFDDTDLLIDLIEAYAISGGATLLFGTLDELIDQGYVAYDTSGSGEKFPTYFEDGIYFKISSSIYDVLEINCNAYIWKGNLGASGGSFHAIFEDEVWIVSQETMWMS